MRWRPKRLNRISFIWKCKIKNLNWTTDIKQAFDMKYSNHLNTGKVWYLNGLNVSGCQMVWFSMMSRAITRSQQAQISCAVLYLINLHHLILWTGQLFCNFSEAGDGQGQVDALHFRELDVDRVLQIIETALLLLRNTRGHSLMTSHTKVEGGWQFWDGNTYFKSWVNLHDKGEGGRSQKNKNTVGICEMVLNHCAFEYLTRLLFSSHL